MRRFPIFLSLLLLLPSLCGCGASAPALSPLTVTLLDAGKADAIFLKSGEGILVIDTGERDDGYDLCRALRKQGAAAVDVLIITHFDRDHVGGAATLCDQFPVGRVLLPDYEGDSAEYRDFTASMAQRGIVPERLRESVSFSFGETEVLVEPPGDFDGAGDGDNDNDFSLITTVCHGSQRLVFAGDAEKARIREWLGGESAQACDFLKLPHHGVYNGALKDLLRRLDPKVTVICDSGKNPAEEKTLSLLEKQGTQVYETRNGTVTLLSDGQTLTVTQG